MSMPSVPEDQFVEAVRSCVESNLDYVSMGACVLAAAAGLCVY